MKIGLIADTHDRLPAIAELVKQLQAGGASMVLHAGDYCSPFSLAPIENAQMSLLGVFGRNDGDPQGLVTRAQSALGIELFESPHSLEVGGRRVLLVHDIGDVNERSVLAHEVVVHGNTHQQELKHRGETLIVNPGEGCGWLFGKPSAALLDLDARRVEFLTLSGPEWAR